MIVLIILGFLALIVIGAVVAAVVVATRQPGQRHVAPNAQPTAREILQTRYARGEITRDEYLRILSDLESNKG
jgi:uncharacterized membrane protein